MAIPKNLQEFNSTLIREEPDKSWPVALKGLWFAAKGDWQSAHDLIDGAKEEMSSWIHAHLHREEGDEWNAAYWYRLAQRPVPKISLQEERNQLINIVLEQSLL